MEIFNENLLILLSILIIGIIILIVNALIDKYNPSKSGKVLAIQYLLNFILVYISLYIIFSEYDLKDSIIHYVSAIGTACIIYIPTLYSKLSKR